MFLRFLPMAAVLLVFVPPVSGAPVLSGDPGKAAVQRQGSIERIGNHALSAELVVSGAFLKTLTLRNHMDGSAVHTNSPFAILLKDGRIYDSGNLRASDPVERDIAPNADASREADRIAGKKIDVALESTDGSVTGTWSLLLIDGSSYVREILTLTADKGDLPISRVELIDLTLPGAHVVGSVQGSPIVASNFFAGFEHPISQSNVTGTRATAWIDRDLPLRAGQTITYSAVFGVVHPGQLRRDFLAYVERERAHPHRTFLHYNSWYDLGYFTPYDQNAAVDRIHAFGEELEKKRGVKLDSFLFDDGWDDHRSLWKFNTGFPNSFTPLKDAAEQYAAAPGVWMSPWGGYSKPKKERIAFGQDAGYEIISNGYALSGPKYYAAFRDVCVEMVQKYGINQFKFDGTGNVNSVFPGSQFDSDFAAAIHLIGELREAKPGIFINLTTGTWPSPFWLRYADSIWRGGEDDAFTGVGNYRERWITYRDSDTYSRIVQNGPLFPLNSLMLHGMIYARFHKHLNNDPGNDFRNEIHSYFGTGTQLQEMYITPSLLSKDNWDDLAEAANWSRTNAAVLKDTHWVGGNPEWLEAYGWASWTPKKAILVLRNPSDKPQTISLKLADTFELPPGAVTNFAARSPWKEDAGAPPQSIDAKQQHLFHLAPFQVLTLDMSPR